MRQAHKTGHTSEQFSMKIVLLKCSLISDFSWAAAHRKKNVTPFARDFWHAQTSAFYFLVSHAQETCIEHAGAFQI